MNDETYPLLHTVEDAARLLSLSRSHTWELISSGELTSIKIGRARRITHDDLVTFVERQKAGDQK